MVFSRSKSSSVSARLLSTNRYFVLSRNLTPALSQQGEARTLAENPNGLSDRERKVLLLVSSGATSKEIARELTVTENTAKVYLRHLLDKLNLGNRQQLPPMMSGRASQGRTAAIRGSLKPRDALEIIQNLSPHFPFRIKV
jgi:DNA-binding NarL/FixJ family response regulator